MKVTSLLPRTVELGSLAPAATVQEQKLAPGLRMTDDELGFSTDEQHFNSSDNSGNVVNLHGMW